MNVTFRFLSERLWHHTLVKVTWGNRRRIQSQIGKFNLKSFVFFQIIGQDKKLKDKIVFNE